jgi:hypothetical protein
VLFAEYNKNDQDEEDQMDRGCGTNGGRRGMHIGYLWESQKEGDY